jgi:hypothetical protein
VSLEQDVQAHLPFFREQAESRMSETCDIGYERPGDFLNEETGEYESAFEAVYSGPCRFKSGNTAAGQIDAAGQLLVEQDQILSLPIATSTGVKRDMVVKITGSLTDPALPGTRARIKSPEVGSYLTARRFAVEVTS